MVKGQGHAAHKTVSVCVFALLLVRNSSSVWIILTAHALLSAERFEDMKYFFTLLLPVFGIVCHPTFRF